VTAAGVVVVYSGLNVVMSNGKCWCETGVGEAVCNAGDRLWQCRKAEMRSSLVDGSRRQRQF